MPDGARVGDRIVGGVRTPLPHDSAHKHVSGEAVYVDDMLEPDGILFAAIGTSDRPHARVSTLDLDGVADAPGVRAVITAADVPGTNDIGPAHAGDPVFAEKVVEYVGQSLFAVAADNVELARRAVKAAVVGYADRQPILGIADALAEESFVLPTHRLERGDPEEALETASNRLAGRIHIGGQDHFYLEGQVALAVPAEDGDMVIYSSTQHPSEVQHAVAKVLGLRDHAVTVDVRRMGGAFGGKETQAALFACVAALLAAKTGRPVKMRLDRDDDMIMTGKRHDFAVEYDVGFDDEGRIEGIDLTLSSRCGMSPDLSGAVNDRALFHCDNAYYLDNVSIVSHRCKTHTISNTAFRGFGGPQGMLAIERVIEDIATTLGRDPLDIRRTNLYGIEERNVTHYGMTVEDNILPELLADLERTSEYRDRRQRIRQFNVESPILKRGIALTPVKFGIAFTTTHLNQGGALIHVYLDGSVHLNHGGTEMGQGLMIKVAQIVAEEFQIDIDRIKITSTTTGKVPNTPATAASSGTDLNGKAAQIAAHTIKQRLSAVAAEHFGCEPNAVQFEHNEVCVEGKRITFTDLVRLAHERRVSLSATGYYRTPKIHYDRKRFRGRPFLYFAYGAAVSEVVIDTLTGEYKVLRTDILHDVGQSINPAVDRGQIEGGFIQGMGWLTSEELYWDEDGRLMTHSPSTYKIPTCSDVPSDFRVRMLETGKNREDVIYRSKAVGEPPLMLALSVFCALRDAVASVANYETTPQLDAPATPERVLLAVEDLRARTNRGAPKAKQSAGVTTSEGKPV